MALTEDERAAIREETREVCAAIVTDVIAAHINACPHGVFVNKTKWTLIGLCIGASAAGGGGLVAGLISVLGG